MIELIDLSKKFGKLQALDKVSLQGRQGQSIALLGPNGCGKTTLIKSILGMVVPDSGQIMFEGKPILGSHAYREHIGYMPQIGRYPDNMRVGQVFDTIEQLRGSQASTDRELYEQYRMGDLLHKRMATLSGGTRQKVSAALAFMFQPSMLILDEPTAGLDPIASEILKEKILAEKSKGKLILITSHLLGELEGLISDAVFMQEGKIYFNKSVEMLKEETGELTLPKAISHLLKKQSR